MTLFGTKRSTPLRGPRPVWPYFFVGAACVLAYGLSAQSLWPWDYPARDQLVGSGGEIRGVSIRDHLSDTGAGARLPSHVSAYITFHGIAGEFEYPWTHPRYSRVGYHVAVYAGILVEEVSLSGPGPYKIWGIEESNHHKPEADQTVVTYDDIVARLERQQKTLDRMLKWMSAGAALFALWGWYTIRWNRRHYPPPTA